MKVWEWYKGKTVDKVVQPPQHPREPRQKSSSEKLKKYLSKCYEFRYNVLSGVNEFRPKGEGTAAFRVLGKRELNAICMDVQLAGISCWDRGLARYVHSTLVEAYHPFELYLQELPAWDGTDRLMDLASRVSSEAY